VDIIFYNLSRIKKSRRMLHTGMAEELLSGCRLVKGQFEN
jgi:hypothetical protein